MVTSISQGLVIDTRDLCVYVCVWGGGGGGRGCLCNKKITGTNFDDLLNPSI